MNALLDIERKLLLGIQDLRRPWLTPIMRVITHLGDGGAMWIGVAAILLALGVVRWRRGRGTAILRVGTVARRCC